MSALSLFVVLAHLGSTLALVGLIWTVQGVHYPLFRRVGRDAFPAYHRGHSTRITAVVGPLMLVEAGTAGLLAWSPPPGVPALSAWSGLALVAGIWLSTAVLQVPRHRELGDGFEARAHRRLVASNWLRTVLWSLRGLLVLWWTARLIA